MEKKVIVKLLKEGNLDEKLMRMRWKPYMVDDEFTGYLISEYGHVYSSKTYKLLNPYLTKQGYYRIAILIGESRKNKFVHRLVAEAFTSYKDPKKNVVNHIDGDKTNCHISNLEWCTLSDNTQHAYDNRLMAKGEKHHLAKNKEEIIKEAIKLMEKGYHNKDIAKKLNLGIGLVRDIKNRKAWRHLTDDNDFILEYNKDRENVANKITTVVKMNKNLSVKEICNIVQIPYDKTNIALINKLKSIIHGSSTTRESYITIHIEI